MCLAVMGEDEFRCLGEIMKTTHAGKCHGVASLPHEPAHTQGAGQGHKKPTIMNVETIIRPYAK
jgi:hypothetical protein